MATGTVGGQHLDRLQHDPAVQFGTQTAGHGLGNEVLGLQFAVVGGQAQEHLVVLVVVAAQADDRLEQPHEAILVEGVLDAFQQRIVSPDLTRRGPARGRQVDAVALLGRTGGLVRAFDQRLGIAAGIRKCHPDGAGALHGALGDFDDFPLYRRPYALGNAERGFPGDLGQRHEHGRVGERQHRRVSLYNRVADIPNPLHHLLELPDADLCAQRLYVIDVHVQQCTAAVRDRCHLGQRQFARVLFRRRFRRQRTDQHLHALLALEGGLRKYRAAAYLIAGGRSANKVERLCGVAQREAADTFTHLRHGIAGHHVEQRHAGEIILVVEAEQLEIGGVRMHVHALVDVGNCRLGALQQQLVAAFGLCEGGLGLLPAPAHADELLLALQHPCQALVGSRGDHVAGPPLQAFGQAFGVGGVVQQHDAQVAATALDAADECANHLRVLIGGTQQHVPLVGGQVRRQRLRRFDELPTRHHAVVSQAVADFLGAVCAAHREQQVQGFGRTHHRLPQSVAEWGLSGPPPAGRAAMGPGIGTRTG